MAGIGEEARAWLILGDFANMDAANKANIIGAGWQVTALQDNGATGAQAVIAGIEVPERHAGEEFAVSLTLTDESGQAVKVPGPAGPTALRIGQIAKAERPNVPGILLQGKVPSRVSVILNFVQGLPLAAGQSYTWSLEIAGHHDPQWAASFFVAGPAQPIVG